MIAEQKLEVVLSRAQLEDVLALLEANGVPGYTIIEDVKGKGERGVQDGLGLTQAFQNVLVMCVCSSEQADALQEPLRILLKKSGGICLRSEVKSLRH